MNLNFLCVKHRKNYYQWLAYFHMNGNAFISIDVFLRLATNAKESSFHSKLLFKEFIRTDQKQDF